MGRPLPPTRRGRHGGPFQPPPYQPAPQVGPPGRYTLYRSIALREAAVRYFTTASYDTTGSEIARERADTLAARSVGAAPSELIAEHFHISEDGQRLYVLSAHETEPDEITPRFRPYRGLARRRPVAT